MDLLLVLSRLHVEIVALREICYEETKQSRIILAKSCFSDFNQVFIVND